MEQIQQSTPRFDISILLKILVAVALIFAGLEFWFDRSHTLQDFIEDSTPEAIAILCISFIDMIISNYQEKLYGNSRITELKKMKADLSVFQSILLTALVIFAFLAEIGSAYLFGRSQEGWWWTLFSTVGIILTLGYIAEKIGHFFAEIEYKSYEQNGRIRYPEYLFWI